MKILYYHQHFSTPKGAAGTRSYEFAKELVRRGHSVTIICGSHWIADSGLSNKFRYGFRKGLVEGIFVIELQLNYSNSDSFLKRTISFLRYSWRGLNIALSEKYDIIFATSTPLTAGIPGVVAKILRRKPFIFEVRDLWPALPKAMGVIKNPFALKTMDLLESITYQSASACIGLSPGIVKGILKKTKNKKVVMIPNGCDLGLAGLNKINNTGKLIAAFTGAHGLANGLDSVLDVARVLIERKITSIEFQFIGDGFLKNSLIQRAKNEKLINCKFLDPKPKLELFHYLEDKVDIGLMILDNIPAFYYGTSPNKFFDYISLGLPVLNNYPGWLADMIFKYNCGIAIPPSKPDEFADALLSLKNDTELLITMGKNAKRLAEKKFDRVVLREQFADLLELNSIE